MMADRQRFNELIGELQDSMHESARSYERLINEAATLQRQLDAERRNHAADLARIARALGISETDDVGSILVSIAHKRDKLRQAEREAVR